MPQEQLGGWSYMPFGYVSDPYQVAEAERETLPEDAKCFMLRTELFEKLGKGGLCSSRFAPPGAKPPKPNAWTKLFEPLPLPQSTGAGRQTLGVASGASPITTIKDVIAQQDDHVKDIQPQSTGAGPETLEVGSGTSSVTIIKDITTQQEDCVKHNKPQSTGIGLQSSQYAPGATTVVGKKAEHANAIITHATGGGLQTPRSAPIASTIIAKQDILELKSKPQSTGGGLTTSRFAPGANAAEIKHDGLAKRVKIQSTNGGLVASRFAPAANTVAIKHDRLAETVSIQPTGGGLTTSRFAPATRAIEAKQDVSTETANIHPTGGGLTTSRFAPATSAIGIKQHAPVHDITPQSTRGGLAASRFAPDTSATTIKQETPAKTIKASSTGSGLATSRSAADASVVAAKSGNSVKTAKLQSIGFVSETSRAVLEGIAVAVKQDASAKIAKSPNTKGGLATSRFALQPASIITKNDALPAQDVKFHSEGSSLETSRIALNASGIVTKQDVPAQIAEVQNATRGLSTSRYALGNAIDAKTDIPLVPTIKSQPIKGGLRTSVWAQAKTIIVNAAKENASTNIKTKSGNKKSRRGRNDKARAKAVALVAPTSGPAKAPVVTKTSAPAPAKAAVAVETPAHTIAVVQTPEPIKTTTIAEINSSIKVNSVTPTKTTSQTHGGLLSSMWANGDARINFTKDVINKKNLAKEHIINKDTGTEGQANEHIAKGNVTVDFKGGLKASRWALIDAPVVATKHTNPAQTMHTPIIAPKAEIPAQIRERSTTPQDARDQSPSMRSRLSAEAVVFTPTNELEHDIQKRYSGSSFSTDTSGSYTPPHLRKKSSDPFFNDAKAIKSLNTAQLVQSAATMGPLQVFPVMTGPAAGPNKGSDDSSPSDPDAAVVVKYQRDLESGSLTKNVDRISDQNTHQLSATACQHVVTTNEYILPHLRQWIDPVDTLAIEEHLEDSPVLASSSPEMSQSRIDQPCTKEHLDDKPVLASSLAELFGITKSTQSAKASYATFSKMYSGFVGQSHASSKVEGKKPAAEWSCALDNGDQFGHTFKKESVSIGLPEVSTPTNGSGIKIPKPSETKLSQGTPDQLNDVRSCDVKTQHDARNGLCPVATDLLDWNGGLTAPPCDWEQGRPFTDQFMDAYIREWSADLHQTVTQVDLKSPKYSSGKCMTVHDKFETPIEHPDAFMNVDQSENIYKQRIQTADIETQQSLRRAAKAKRNILKSRIANASLPPNVLWGNVRVNSHIPAVATYLRPAEAKDIPQITSIYNHYVVNSIIPEDQTEISVSNMLDFLTAANNCKQPFIVAVRDELVSACRNRAAEMILGFAYAKGQTGIGGGIIGRSRQMASGHVYVHPEHRRKRVGSCLLDRLLTCTSQIHRAKNSCIFVNTNNDPVYERVHDGGMPRYNDIQIELPTEVKDDPDLPWIEKWLKKSRFQDVGCIQGSALSASKNDQPARPLNVTIFQASAAGTTSFTNII